MFAAGTHLDDDKEESNKDWQFSSTFDSKNFLKHQKSEEEKKLSQNVFLSSVKKKAKKKRKAPRDEHLDFKKVFIEDMPFLKDHEAFRIDKSCDKNIYDYKSIYEGYVPKYRPNRYANILGLSNVTLDSFTERDNEKFLQEFKDYRYFSKKFVKSFKKDLGKTIISDSSLSKSENISDFIPITTPLMIKEPTSEETLVQKCSKLIANLNEKVMNNPRNLQNWFDLMDCHLYRGHLQNGLNMDSENLILTVFSEINAFIERALRSHPGSLKLRLLSVRLSETVLPLIFQGRANIKRTSLSITDEQLDRDWSQLVFTYPQEVSVWRGYIAFLKNRQIASISSSNNALFSSNQNVIQGQYLGAMHFQKINAAYKRAFTTLSNILTGRTVSHKPCPNTPLQVIDLFTEYCQWLRDAGHTEKALANWQAAIEFNCFLPPSLYDEALISSKSYSNPSGGLMNIINHDLIWKNFQEFWQDKSAFKYPHPEARGWSIWFENRGKNYEHIPEDCPATSNNFADIQQALSMTNDVESSKKVWNTCQSNGESVVSQVEDFLMKQVNLDKINLFETVTSTSASYEELLSVKNNLKSSLASRDVLTKSSSLNASVSHKHALLRGQCWLGLERARDLAYQLPYNLISSNDSDVEDTERIVGINDIVRPIEFALIAERHFDNAKQIRIFSINRLLLTFLKIYGLTIPEDMQEFFNLTPDILEFDKLTKLDVVKAAGFQEYGHEMSDFRLHLLSNSLRHSFYFNVKDTLWNQMLTKTKFQFIQDHLPSLISKDYVNSKHALAYCKEISKEIISKDPSNLAYYQYYVKLLIACHRSLNLTKGAEHFVKELNSLFRKLSQLAPIDWSFTNNPGTVGSVEKWTDEIHPRLQLAMIHFNWLFEVDLVNKGKPIVNFEKSPSFWKAAKHCLQRILSGDVENQDPDAATHLMRTRKRGIAHLKSLMNLPENFSLLSELAAILGYSHSAYTLVTIGVTGFFDILPELISILRSLGNCSASGLSINASIRFYLRLMIPLLTAFSKAKVQHPSELIHRFLTFFEQPQTPILITVNDFHAIIPNIDNPTSLTFLDKFNLKCYLRKMRKSLLRIYGTYDSIASTLSLKSTEERQILKDYLNGLLESLAPPIHQSISHLELFIHLQPSLIGVIQLSIEISRWKYYYSLSSSDCSDPSQNKLYAYTAEAASNRLRSIFESFLAHLPLSQFQIEMNSMISESLQSDLDETLQDFPIKSQLFSITPSPVVNQIRAYVWRAYMNFEWMNTEYFLTAEDINKVKSEKKREKLINKAVELARQRRSRVKAIFYRAIQDCPLSKFLYMDLISYFPYDITEIIELMAERGLRVRTAMEEIDLLITASM